jgi:hypothetical protein
LGNFDKKLEGEEKIVKFRGTKRKSSSLAATAEKEIAHKVLKSIGN